MKASSHPFGRHRHQALSAWCRGDVTPDKKSTLTIATPLEVPGAILDPGTYVVKQVDTQNNRNIVTITSVDEKKIFATAICTPHVAAEDPRHTTFMFYSTPEGANKVLRTWYRPERSLRSGLRVSAGPGRCPQADDERGGSRVDGGNSTPSMQSQNRPAPVAVVSDAEPPKPIEPPPPAPVVETVPAPAPAMAPEPAPATMTADASETLPKTASKTPLVLAAGILALGVASGLRFAGRS